jgi:hypothetical protein
MVDRESADWAGRRENLENETYFLCTVFIQGGLFKVLREKIQRETTLAQVAEDAPGTACEKRTPGAEFNR